MTPSEVRRIIDRIVDTLEGDWILVGGALLNFLKVSDRQTLDIDLVPVNKATNEDQLKIVEIAVDNGLPPEAINFAAEYFVKKQAGWKNQIVLIKTTKKARLYRPSKKLFRQLKESRGTPTDLKDIQVFEENIKDK